MNKAHWIGLSGSHRVGKTTLAIAYADTYGYLYKPTGVSTIQKKYGYDSAKQDYSFSDRIKIQNHIIEDVINLYGEWAKEGKPVITDRTPLDFIGYTLLAVHENCTDSDYENLQQYIELCKTMQSMFETTVVVQPGIQIVPDSKSASASQAYIHKLNSLILGETWDMPTVNVMPAHIINLEERKQFISDLIK